MFRKNKGIVLVSVACALMLSLVACTKQEPSGNPEEEFITEGEDTKTTVEYRE